MRFRKRYRISKDEITAGLMRITDPDTGERMVERVARREEIYGGEALDRAADLIIVPRRGYDPKGGFGKPGLTGKGKIVGMHTYDDAFFCMNRELIRDRRFSILDVAPTILSLLGIDVPPEMEGKVVLD